MELSSHEEDIPLPISSTYVGVGHGHGQGHGSMIHHDHHPHHHAPHNHIISSSSASQLPSNNNNNNNNGVDDDHHHHHASKKMVRYKECLKNHAAAMGGNATDGCGEFMPSGEEGSIEALTCSACNCHRNFHRKEVEGEQQQQQPNAHFTGNGRKLILGHPHHLHNKNILSPEALRYATPRQMIMSYNMGGGGGGSLLASESDEQEDGGVTGGGGVMMVRPAPISSQAAMKKRFRTKFTPEQKEKMLNFAEKLGWKMQKQEEAGVQQFCQELGIKRRVLKVWMHNNKHNLAKKNGNHPTTTTTTATTTTT